MCEESLYINKLWCYRGLWLWLWHYKQPHRVLQLLCTNSILCPIFGYWNCSRGYWLCNFGYPVVINVRFFLGLYLLTNPILNETAYRYTYKIISMYMMNNIIPITYYPDYIEYLWYIESYTLKQWIERNDWLLKMYPENGIP